MTIKIYRGRDCVHHDVSSEHPENPDRLYAIDDQLLSSGLEMICQHGDAKQVKRENLALAHDPYYVDSIFQRSPRTPSQEMVGRRKTCSKNMSSRQASGGGPCSQGLRSRPW